MIAPETAYAYLEAAAVDLKSLSYQELERLAKRHGSADEWQTREVQVEGDIVYISTKLARLGRFRKRVSVEIVLGVESEEKPSRCPFIYFERFESGRFYPSPQEEARNSSIFKALPYALAGGVVIALLALAWGRK